jgi:endoglucanase
MDTADYHVSTGKRTHGNNGLTYRNDGVDIAEMKNDPGKFYVTDMKEGEWLQYTLQAGKAGKYDLALKVSASVQEGKLTLMINGKEVGNAIIPVTNVKGKWMTITISNVSLLKGQNKMRIVVNKDGCEFAEIRFSKSSDY